VVSPLPHCPVHNCLLTTVVLYLLIAANRDWLIDCNETQIREKPHRWEFCRCKRTRKGTIIANEKCRSGGFGITATRTPVSRIISINFLDEWAKADSGFSSVEIPSSDAVSIMTFQVAVLLWYIVFFSDFPVITASYFITNGISITLIQLCLRINKNQTTHLFLANFNKNHNTNQRHWINELVRK